MEERDDALEESDGDREAYLVRPLRRLKERAGVEGEDVETARVKGVSRGRASAATQAKSCRGFSSSLGRLSGGKDCDDMRVKKNYS